MRRAGALAGLALLIATGAHGQAAAPVAGTADAPPAPTDHAADSVFDPAAMAAARTQLALEHGGGAYSMVLANIVEHDVGGGGSGGYRWDGQASFGGDIDRFVVKSEGEGADHGGVDTAEVQALFSRALGPYFDLQAGLRQDLGARPPRTYATLGLEGLAPYWFEVSGALFLSTRGELLGRIEGYYDLRITQRLILQPRAEFNLAAQDVRDIGVAAGISDAELALRLRSQVTPQFAPDLGVAFERRVGAAADYARAAGERADQTRIVAGARAMF